VLGVSLSTLKRDWTRVTRDAPVVHTSLSCPLLYSGVVHIPTRPRTTNLVSPPTLRISPSEFHAASWSTSF
jgi:hypothetical protein